MTEERSLAHAGNERLAGWSDSLLRTLASVFDTFSPVSAELAERRAHLAAETLSAVTDPDELRLLHLSIRALEWPPVLLITAGRWGRFTHLDRRGRELVLIAWSRHRLGALRTAFQALKRLGLFLAYADPGSDGGGNPSWPAIGYEVPRPAPPAPMSAISAMEVDRTSRQTLALEAEVAVVGSGAGGGVVAARLAEAGMQVLIIEAGPYLPETEMPVHEATGMQRLYLDHGTTATSDLGITILAGSVLGGGTTINWTTSLAPPEWLRDEWEHVHGLVGMADAVTDADLTRLRRELDLQPPTVIPPKDAVILDGARVLGWEAAPTERDAGPCTDCGSCGFGCRYAAKRSGPRMHLATAAAHGARILVGARVQRVELHGGRAVGVTGVLGSAPGGPAGGRAFTVRARRVVLAAGALRTPLILHASGLDHPQIGRNLRLHPVVAVAATMPRPIEMWCGPTQAARSLEFWRPGEAVADVPAPAHGGFVIESAPVHPGLFASAMPWFGAIAAAEHIAQAARVAPLIGIIRDRGAGHVHPTRHLRPRIDYRLAPADAATARRALVELARLARAAGAEEVVVAAQPGLRHRPAGDDADFQRFLRQLATVDTAPNRLSLFSAHQMGSVRAGRQHAAYPCDPHGRVRADASGTVVGGLYVGDASLFPSASGVNPMVTIMALAERTARAVLEDRAAA